MTDKKPIRDHDRFIIRMPDGMKDLLSFRAEIKNQSINSEIVEILAKHIKLGQHGQIAAIRSRLGMLRAIQMYLRNRLAEVEKEIDQANTSLEQLREDDAQRDD